MIEYWLNVDNGDYIRCYLYSEIDFDINRAENV